MHLKDAYGSYLGIIPNKKPIVNTQFFPIPFDKYITLHAADGKISSKHYDYFPEVINLVKPALHHLGIKIIQVGGPEDMIVRECDATYLNLTRAQSAYVCKNAMLAIGVDSFVGHLASSFDVPTVTVFGHTYPSQCKPAFSSPEKNACLVPVFKDRHPCFAPQEYPKSINAIYPETIANAILLMLKCDFNVKVATKFIGEHYHHSVVEVIPDFFGESAELKNVDLNIRLDLNFDQQCAYAWAQHYTVKLITDKPVDLDLLRAGRKNIRQLTLKISRPEDFSLEYVKEAKKIIPALMMVGMDEKTISDVREKFFDWTVERMPAIDRNIIDALPVGCKFQTKKVIFSKAQRFPSLAHWKMKKPFDAENFVVDSEDFCRDIHHFYIYA